MTLYKQHIREYVTKMHFTNTVILKFISHHSPCYFGYAVVGQCNAPIFRRHQWLLFSKRPHQQWFLFLKGPPSIMPFLIWTQTMFLNLSSVKLERSCHSAKEKLNFTIFGQVPPGSASKDKNLIMASGPWGEANISKDISWGNLHQAAIPELKK